MERDSKKWKAISIIGFILLIMTPYFRHIYVNDQLRKYGVITVARVDYKLTQIYRQSATLNYYYKFSDTYYDGFFSPTEERSAFFFNKDIPVLISKRNPKISRPLLSPEAFEKYGYTFPDSLKWISEIAVPK